MMKVQWNDENHTDFLGNWNQGFEHPFFLKKKKKLESEKKKKKTPKITWNMMMLSFVYTKFVCWKYIGWRLYINF